MSESAQLFSEYMEAERAEGQLLSEFDARCGWDAAWDIRQDEIAALQARIKEPEAAARWIPVGERLPDDRTTVIIGCNNGDYITIAMWVAGLWFGEDTSNPEPWTDVTHWMNLPEPPEEKI